MRGFYGEYLEPALELCMKIQRMPALTVFEMSVDALIRVVPPRFSVPCREENFGGFCAYNEAGVFVLMIQEKE